MVYLATMLNLNQKSYAKTVFLFFFISRQTGRRPTLLKQPWKISSPKVITSQSEMWEGKGCCVEREREREREGGGERKREMRHTHDPTYAMNSSIVYRK